MKELHPQLAKNQRSFVCLMISLEIVVIIIYKYFFTVYADTLVPLPSNNELYYPMYQDVNVMMLIGFGFLMTFVKLGSWSALAYTFFINAIVVQFYLMWSAFWERVLSGDWTQGLVIFREQNFTAASYSVASILIAFGAVLGRVGPYQLLVMGMVQVCAYALNQYICYSLIKIYDAGGSTVIHTFGAYFGLTVSLVLSWKKRPSPQINPSTSKQSITFAVIGTLFLWMFWPSFNAGFSTVNGEQKTVIISNTILSLTGSCLGAFIITSFFRQKLDMQDILNATLAGGVAIGAPSGLFTNPAASLCTGLGAGMISTFGFIYLSKFLNNKIGLYDTCGVNNLHGIPGIIGGILSSIAIAAYQSSPIGSNLGNNLSFYSNNSSGRSFSIAACYQLAGLAISLVIGILGGIIAGFIMSLMYNMEDQHFYNDTAIFDTLEHEQQNQLVQDISLIDPKIQKQMQLSRMMLITDSNNIQIKLS